MSFIMRALIRLALFQITEIGFDERTLAEMSVDCLLFEATNLAHADLMPTQDVRDQLVLWFSRFILLALLSIMSMTEYLPTHLNV